MSEIRQRIAQSKKSHDQIDSSKESSLYEKSTRASIMEDDRGIKKEEGDILEPLINISTPPNDEKSSASDTSVNVQRDPSKLGLFSLVGLSIVLFQVSCEVMKQLSNYSLQYYNDGRFPIPQTIIVIIVAFVKLLTTVLRDGGKCPISKHGLCWATVRTSFRFLVPAILYGINNNIYFFGLTLVAPPIWLILCSFRTIITASTYKFFLNRPISRGQFFGCFVIVISLVVAKLPDILQIINRRQDSAVIDIVADIGNDNSTDSSDSTPTISISNDALDQETVNSVPLMAIFLALIASCNSVGAALYTESLFKSNTVKGETFLDQQFWMYFYETGMAILLHSLTNPSYSVMSLLSDVLDMKTSLQLILVVAIMCGSIGGIVVASILKLLDNIVKEYAGSTANILTAVLCAVLFPDKFEFTVYIMLSMGCLFTGIYLYESQKVKPKSSSVTNTSTKSLNETKT